MKTIYPNRNLSDSTQESPGKREKAGPVPPSVQTQPINLVKIYEL